MLRFARGLLSVFMVANWAVGGLLVLGLVVGGFVRADQTAALALKAHPHLSAANVILALRITLLAMLPMMWLCHLLFRNLAEIIDSVPAGKAFTEDNAARLRTVGWVTVAVSTLDWGWGFALLRLLGPYGGWSPSFGEWLIALLMFVLAAIWSEGVKMRADLEGTV